MKRIALLTMGLVAVSLTFAQQKTEAAKVAPSTPAVVEAPKPAKDITKYFEFTLHLHFCPPGRICTVAVMFVSVPFLVWGASCKSVTNPFLMRAELVQCRS